MSRDEVNSRLASASKVDSKTYAELTKNGVYGALLPGDWPRAVDAVVRAFGGRLDSTDGKRVQGYMDSAATANPSFLENPRLSSPSAAVAACRGCSPSA